MVQSRIPKPEIEIKITKTPEEVLRLQSLLCDNWWKMLVERLNTTISDSEKIIRATMPLWLSIEQKMVYMDDMEKIKIKINAYGELLQLPYDIMKEYWETEFTIDKSEEV